MDFQIKEIKTGDIVLSASRSSGLAAVTRWMTGSLTNHAGLCVWSTSDKAHINDSKVDQSFIPHYEEKAQLYILHNIPFNDKVAFTPIESYLKSYTRTIHRGVNFTDEQQHLDKFKKFYHTFKDTKTGASNAAFLDSWLATIPPEYDFSYESESCVGFVLLWLHTLGFHASEPGVPQRHRQLYTPDHLRVDYSQSKVLANKETMISNKVGILSGPMYVFTITVILTLTLGIIFLVKNPIAIICFFIAFLIVFRKLFRF